MGLKKRYLHELLYPDMVKTGTFRLTGTSTLLFSPKHACFGLGFSLLSFSIRGTSEYLTYDAIA